MSVGLVHNLHFSKSCFKMPTILLLIKSGINIYNLYIKIKTFIS